MKRIPDNRLARSPWPPPPPPPLPRSRRRGARAQASTPPPRSCRIAAAGLVTPLTNASAAKPRWAATAFLDEPLKASGASPPPQVELLGWGNPRSIFSQLHQTRQAVSTSNTNPILKDNDSDDDRTTAGCNSQEDLIPTRPFSDRNLDLRSDAAVSSPRLPSENNETDQLICVPSTPIRQVSSEIVRNLPEKRKRAAHTQGQDSTKLGILSDEPRVSSYSRKRARLIISNPLQQRQQRADQSNGDFSQVTHPVNLPEIADAVGRYITSDSDSDDEARKAEADLLASLYARMRKTRRENKALRRRVRELEIIAAVADTKTCLESRNSDCDSRSCAQKQELNSLKLTNAFLEQRLSEMKAAFRNDGEGSPILCYGCKITMW